MTDRDRLIELIAEVQYMGGLEEKLADHLLTNGVIVSHTRCKDCTYLRESDKTNRLFCTYHGDSYEFETQPNDYCSNGVGVAKGA